MSLASKGFRLISTLNDKTRDKDLKVDPEVQAHYDIQYGEAEKYNSLDIYYPRGTKRPLPVIVNFHGGGFVYGTKENYLHYGMYLAKKGFVIVNANYHLAPKKSYPTQLEELNQVMAWMVANHNDYFMDISNVFIVGDSAGAQLALQYSALYSNEEYKKLFSFRIPEGFILRGIALNCGMFNIYEKMASMDNDDKKDADIKLTTLLTDYLSEDWEQYEKQLAVQDHITDSFPPTYMMTAENDFLREETLPMVEVLTRRGVDVTYKKYGEEGENQYTHIFHCNMNLEEAKVANNEQCDFFKSFVQEKES